MWCAFLKVYEGESACGRVIVDTKIGVRAGATSECVSHNLMDERKQSHIADILKYIDIG